MTYIPNKSSSTSGLTLLFYIVFILTILKLLEIARRLSGLGNEVSITIDLLYLIQLIVLTWGLKEKKTFVPNFSLSLIILPIIEGLVIYFTTDYSALDYGMLEVFYSKEYLELQTRRSILSQTFAGIIIPSIISFFLFKRKEYFDK
ncbi:MAG: hypothetical protein INQ03_10280 [Candidatus Heimdallarchaeota archaeon]|nr:hypothetical protein [Candidatus Heimdallarchaeota archaeon]